MSDSPSDVGNSEALPLLLPAPDAAAPSTQNPTSPPPHGTNDKPTSPAKPRRSVWPYWLAAAFVSLAAGEAYLFVQQQMHQADKTQLDVLQVEVGDMRANADKTSPIAALIAAQEQLAEKQAMLAGQVAAVQNQVVADHTALAALQVNAQEISALTTRMAQLNMLAAARMALEAGQPLGVIAHAPTALSMFADTAPPTMLQLKEAFPAVARHAEAVSLMDAEQGHFWNRVKARLESLITISNGQHVIFGPPAAAALNRMRAALANDDLPNAVAAAETLSPSTQAAMASWLIPAQQLLAARQALLTLAKQGT